MLLYFRFLNKDKVSDELYGNETLRRIIKSLFDIDKPILEDKDVDLDGEIRNLPVEDGQLIKILSFEINPDKVFMRRFL